MYVYFQTPVSVAFTPTSVIRKMHSEKASEKEKQKTENEKDSEIPGMYEVIHFKGKVLLYGNGKMLQIFV